MAHGIFKLDSFLTEIYNIIMPLKLLGKRVSTGECQMWFKFAKRCFYLLEKSHETYHLHTCRFIHLCRFEWLCIASACQQHGQPSRGSNTHSHCSPGRSKNSLHMAGAGHANWTCPVSTDWIMPKLSQSFGLQIYPSLAYSLAISSLLSKPRLSALH